MRGVFLSGVAGSVFWEPRRAVIILLKVKIGHCKEGFGRGRFGRPEAGPAPRRKSSAGFAAARPRGSPCGQRQSPEPDGGGGRPRSGSAALRSALKPWGKKKKTLKKIYPRSPRNPEVKHMNTDSVGRPADPLSPGGAALAARPPSRGPTGAILEVTPRAAGARGGRSQPAQLSGIMTEDDGFRGGGGSRQVERRKKGPRSRRPFGPRGSPTAAPCPEGSEPALPAAAPANPVPLPLVAVEEQVAGAAQALPGGR